MVGWAREAELRGDGRGEGRASRGGGDAELVGAGWEEDAVIARGEAEAGVVVRDAEGDELAEGLDALGLVAASDGGAEVAARLRGLWRLEGARSKLSIPAWK